MQAWGLELLDRMAPVAALLDAQSGGTEHALALAAQREKLHDVEQTPAARVLREVRAHQNSFATFALQNSQQQAAQFLARPLTAEQVAGFVATAEASLSAQNDIERTQTGDFDTFVAAYRASTLGNISV